MIQRKREFKGDVRFVPGQEDEIDEEERLALEIKELKKEKEKFTNVTAPKVSDETHFHVEELDIGQEVSDAKTSPGFSFGFNFVPEEKSDSEDEDVEEKQQIEKNKQIEKQKAKIISKAETPKVITTGEKFNLFKEYAHTLCSIYQSSETRHPRIETDRPTTDWPCQGFPDRNDRLEFCYKCRTF